MSNLQGETTVPEDIEESQNVDLSAMMRSMAELFGGKCKKVYEKVILKLEGWLRAMEEVALVNQASEMTQSWNAYLGECAIATNNAPLQAKREAELVHAGDLFASYLSAFLCNFSARFHPVAE